MLYRMSRYKVIWKNSWRFNGLNLDLLFQPSKWKKLDVSYMIHWTKLLLKTKISPRNHIFKDDLNKYFPKESINKYNYSYHK